MAPTDLYSFDPDPSRPETEATPPVVNCAPSAGTLLTALRRRWLLASGLGLSITAVVALSAWFLLPSPPHTARSQVYIASDQPVVLFHTSETRSDSGAFRQTQQALLKSRLVLNAALRQPKVAELSVVRAQEDPVAWLEKELKVMPAASPEILSVSLGGDQAQQVKILVDAVVNAYMQEIVNKEQTKRQARLDHLKTIAGQYDEQLRRKRRTMRELVENVGTADKQALALMQMFNVEQYHLTQKELLQVRSELRRLQTEAAGRDGEAPVVDLPMEAINEAMQKDPVLARHQAVKQQLEEELSEARRTLVRPDTHPAIKRYLDDIVVTQKFIDKRREEMRPQVEARVRERLRLDYASTSAQVEKRIDYCKRLEKQLAEDMKRLEDETRTRNKGAFDAENLKNEIAQAEEVSRKVAEEVEKLTVELQAESRVRVLEDATIDWGDGRSKQFRNVAAASVVTLALVILGVAWWEFRSRRVESVEQVVQGLGLKLVGALPPARQPATVEGPTGAGERAFHESVAAARTMLLHVADTESVQVVMVTSAVAGEGKTSLASQLAASLARAGHKTLLVDGDLRKPEIHEVFGATAEPGLCELLRGEVGAAQAIQRAAIANLWLMPAGMCDGRALQALARPRIKEVLEDMKDMFQFVIVDSSPVLPIADAVQIGRHVDGVIVSILRNVSRLPKVHSATQRLSQFGVRMLGAVVLNAQAEHSDYGYHPVPAEVK